MKPRRWFRFSLRTFFGLTTLLAVWLGVQVKWIRDREAALTWIQGTERSDWSAYWSDGVYEVRNRQAPWSIRWLGAQGVARIGIFDLKHSRYSIERMKALFPEAIQVSEISS